MKLQSTRLKQCHKGSNRLKFFLLTSFIFIIFTLLCWYKVIPGHGLKSNLQGWLITISIVVVVESIIFWSGMLRIYFTSLQLGVKWRVIAAICGFIPIVNLLVLGKMLAIVDSEVQIENEKIILNDSRKDENLCQTKYPILLVHGVFFRDFRYLNYWGRIPGELKANGAKVFYGEHQSAACVKVSGEELAIRIKTIVEQTGCEKLNVIAHSKGGLDMRYAISQLGMDKYVASLTTINTPHRGCEFADYLLEKIPESGEQKVASVYNYVFKYLGDDTPDFLEAVYDLTASKCQTFNENVPDSDLVYYQSVGSKQNVAKNGRFPLNFTYRLVKYFDGANDGLVGEKSFPWGDNYTFLTVKGKRGISHADMIDLNRDNIKEFDVREFYVQLVNGLKKKGF